MALQLIYGALWLGTGLLARDLTRRLAGDEVAAYVAGALTLCATSDFLTDSPIELGYDISAISSGRVLCAVRWIQGRPATSAGGIGGSRSGQLVDRRRQSPSYCFARCCSGRAPVRTRGSAQSSQPSPGLGL